MFDAFLWCVGAGLITTMLSNVLSSARWMSVLKSLQDRHYGGLLFYLVMTSLTFGILFFVIFFVVNLLFHWV